MQTVCLCIEEVAMENAQERPTSYGAIYDSGISTLPVSILLLAGWVLFKCHMNTQTNVLMLRLACGRIIFVGLVWQCTHSLHGV
jgi:hypothetical protein